MFGIGGWELLLVAVVALLVLGPKGLPSAARAVGRVVSELRRATTDLRQSLELDPELKELPRALDEINRPLLSPSPYSRKRPPRDGPPGEQKPPDSAAAGEDQVETTRTKGSRVGGEPPMAEASLERQRVMGEKTEAGPEAQSSDGERQLEDRGDGGSGG